MADWLIRSERLAEFRAVETLVRDAFWDLFRPGCDEHFLVWQLRQDAAYQPDLSFVAEWEGQLAGCIFYAEATLAADSGATFPVLTFGPLAVRPDLQRRGLGGALIEHTIELARQTDYAAIVIYGNPDYYGRFGFRPGEIHGIADGGGDFCPALLVLELQPGALAGHVGRFREGEAYRVDPVEAEQFDRMFPPRRKHALPAQIFLGQGTIRPVPEADFEEVYEIINEAAEAYRGIIPADRWHEPYMPREELREQIADGVVFHGYYVNGLPVGVMGIQDKGEVDLIRHAYVRTACRQLGLGGKLLEHLHAASAKPMLIGTWADATWAIRFYEKHGFARVADVDRKNALLRRFWNIPDRQVETSVVLTDGKGKID